MIRQIRVTRLEQVLEPKPEGPIRIRVIRVPADIPEDAADAWIAAYPEAVDKIIEVRDNRVVEVRDK